MIRRGVAHDGQAQSDAAGVQAARRIQPDERLGDPLQVGIGDARAVVLDQDPQFACRVAQTNRHDAAMRDRVVDQLADGEAALALGFQVRWQRACAAQEGPDACQQLARTDGLDEVVVGAHLDAQDAVGLLAARVEHQHGQVRLGAQVAAQDQTVGVGQHQVEHHEVDGVLAQHLPHLALAGRRQRIELVARQILRQQLADLGVVVDDEDTVLVVHGKSVTELRPQVQSVLYRSVASARSVSLRCNLSRPSHRRHNAKAIQCTTLPCKA